MLLKEVKLTGLYIVHLWAKCRNLRLHWSYRLTNSWPIPGLLLTGASCPPEEFPCSRLRDAFQLNTGVKSGYLSYHSLPQSSCPFELCFVWPFSRALTHQQVSEELLLTGVCTILEIQAKVLDLHVQSNLAYVEYTRCYAGLRLVDMVETRWVSQNAYMPPIRQVIDTSPSYCSERKHKWCFC